MNILKKQGVAWCVVIVLILIAIAIGRGKSSDTPHESADSYYVYDDARVLTAREAEKLSNLNHKLADKYGTVIACVTTNYNRDDLYDFAMDYAEQIHLQEYDFLIVLDISGDNYWLIQGAGLVREFTDDDCENYAWDHMEKDFSKGNYGNALYSLAKALSTWYDRNF